MVYTCILYCSFLAWVNYLNGVSSNLTWTTVKSISLKTRFTHTSVWSSCINTGRIHSTKMIRAFTLIGVCRKTDTYKSLLPHIDRSSIGPSQPLLFGNMLMLSVVPPPKHMVPMYFAKWLYTMDRHYRLPHWSSVEVWNGVKCRKSHSTCGIFQHKEWDSVWVCSFLLG